MWAQQSTINFVIQNVLVRPKIIASTPFDQDIEFPLDSQISVTFSKKMTKSSVERAFRIDPNVDGDFQWEGNTLIFKPKESFKRDQLISITVDKSARARTMINLSEPYTIRFTTLSNPNIALAAPKGNITKPVESIVVMFNKSVKKPEGEILKVMPDVEGERKWIGSAAYIIKPKNLSTGQTYTVELVQDLESVDGGLLEKGHTFGFVNFAPAALHVNAQEGIYASQNETNPRGPITIYFNQRVNAQDIVEKFTLTDIKTSEEIPVRERFISRVADDDKQYYYRTWEEKWVQKVQFFPTVTLDPETSYLADLDAGFLNENGLAKSENGVSLSFRTASLPGFVTSSIRDGEVEVTQNRRLEFTFKSPMDRDELEKNMVISPKDSVSSGVHFISTYSNDKMVSLNRFLDRSTKFDVFIPATVKDKFGRPLGENVRISFTTSPYKPSLSIRPGSTYFATFASNIDTRFITRVTNISELEFNLFSVDLNQFINLQNTSRSDWSLINLTKAQQLGYKKIGTWKQQLDIELNIPTETIYNINEDAGTDLKPGFYFLDITATKGALPTENRHDNIAFVIGDISVTTKVSHEKFLVWATSLEKTEVKKGYDVEVFAIGLPYSDANSLNNSTPPNSLLKGKTNQDGVLFTDNTSLSKGNTGYLTVVKGNNDIGITMSNWDSGISPYQFRTSYSGGFLRDGPERFKAFAITDRSLYRPGDTVKYKAFIRNNDLHEFSIPQEKVTGTITVASRSNSKSNIHTANIDTSINSSFDGEFRLPDSAKLGRYSLSVKAGGKNLYVASFDVQEFVVPEFEVISDVPKDDVIRGDSIKISGTGRYFYGAPMINSPTDYRLYKRNFTFSWSEDRRFSFYSSRLYFGDDNIWRGFEESEVLENSGRTGTDGSVTISPSTSTKSGVSEIYTFETDILGENGRKLTDSGEYVVHMAEHYTGIKTKSYVGTAEKESEFEIKTINPNGEEVKDVDVNIKVYKRNYFRVKNKENTGSTFYETSFEDELIHTDSIETDSKGSADFSFTPEKGGLHIVEVESFDRRGNRSIADTRLYVGSKESGFWRRENHDRVELITDKNEYKPGETAKIVATSTLESTVGLLTIEAEDIIDYKTFKQESSSDLLELEIKDTYIPNVYVSAIFVEPGTSVFDPAEFRMGTEKIQVDSSKFRLNVELSTNKEKYSPKESGEVFVTIKDLAGARVRNAEVTLALVDDALITISPIKRANVFEHFYSSRRLGVTTTQSLTKSLDRINANTEIGAKGGSGSKGGAGGEYVDLTREDFSETAMWTATVITNENGEAKVPFTLPDSITRWNLFAIAQDDSGSKFGQNIHKFGSSVDVVGMPALPRFLRVEDTFELSVVVHNNTSSDKRLTVGVQTEGIRITDSYTKFANVSANTQQKVVFNANAQNEGSAKITFTIMEAENVMDVVKKDIPILPFGLEVVQSTANTVNYNALEEFTVDETANKNFGGLTTEVYGSFIGIAKQSMSAIQTYKHPSTINVSSKLTPLVFKYNFDIKQSKQSDQYTKQKIQDLLHQLVNLQGADGGWGYWKDSKKSNVHTTSKAVEALALADRSGFEVDQTKIVQGVAFIQSYLNKQPASSSIQDTNPYLIHVLELAHIDQTGRIQLSYQNRTLLSDYSKAYLILAMKENRSDWGRFVDQLIGELVEKTDLGSQRAFWTSPRGSWYIGNEKAVTAAVLRAFNKTDPNNPAAKLAIRYLAQEDKTYKNSYTQSMVATAIFENAINKGIKLRANEVSLSINDAKIAEGKIESSGKFVHFTPVSELKDGVNTTEISLSKGGDSYYGMVLKILLPFERVEEGSNEIAIARDFLDAQGNEIKNNTFVVGESYIVRLTVVAPNIRRNLVLEDYLAGGFESVNGTLENESSLTVAKARQAADKNEDARTLYVSNVQMRNSQTDIFINSIGTGLYEYVYVIRATTPGTYKLRPAQIFEMYSPDIRANTDGGLINVISSE